MLKSYNIFLFLGVATLLFVLWGQNIYPFQSSPRIRFYAIGESIAVFFISVSIYIKWKNPLTSFFLGFAISWMLNRCVVILHIFEVDKQVIKIGLWRPWQIILGSVGFIWSSIKLLIDERRNKRINKKS